MATTKALLCTTYGGAEQLTFSAIPLEPLAKDQVKIEVHYVGMNFPDALLLQGKDQYRPTLPFSPCGELSGVILEVGEQVTDLHVGDRVLAGGMVYGATRTIVQLPQRQVYKIPDSMPFEDAAAFCCANGTAIHCLKDRAQLKAGQTVAVLGASGGVGTAVIQVAKAMNAEVIACASTDEKLAYCKEEGADQFVNYTREDLKNRLKELTQQRGVDVVCDPIGSDYSEQALRAIAWDGRFMVLGFAAGQIARIPLNLPLLKGCHITGVFWSTFARKFPDWNRRNIQQCLQWYEEGKISVRIHDVIPVEQYRHAFEILGSRTVRGRLLMKVI
jgi:NADPH2:quinone reductase